jgi:hypothetical protein
LTFTEIHRESESGGSRRGRTRTEDGKEEKRSHVERAVVEDGPGPRWIRAWEEIENARRGWDGGGEVGVHMKDGIQGDGGW